MHTDKNTAILSQLDSYNYTFAEIDMLVSIIQRGPMIESLMGQYPSLGLMLKSGLAVECMGVKGPEIICSEKGRVIYRTLFGADHCRADAETLSKLWRKIAEYTESKKQEANGH